MRTQAADGSLKEIGNSRAPKEGDVLEFNATTGKYEPTTPNPNNVTKSETVTTAASAKAVDLEVYQTKVITGHATGALTIANGTIVGQRKLITLLTIGTENDVVNFTEASFSQGADTIDTIVLDAEGEFLLVEWQGAKWEVIKASTGVVTVAE